MLLKTLLLAFLCSFFWVGEVKSEEKLVWMSIGANSGDLGTYPAFSFGYKNGDLAFEVGGISYFGSIESYPAPHRNFTNKGEFNTGSLGFDGLYYPNLNIFERIKIFAGVGVYFNQIRDIAESNVSNRRYTQDVSYNLSPALSAGIDMQVSKKEESLTPLRSLLNSIGVGYHTIRGINVRFVFDF